MLRHSMVELHCQECGGFISSLRHISYRIPVVDETPAHANDGLCECTTPILYGPPPGYLSSPGMPIPGHQSRSR